MQPGKPSISHTASDQCGQMGASSCACQRTNCLISSGFGAATSRRYLSRASWNSWKPNLSAARNCMRSKDSLQPRARRSISLVNHLSANSAVGSPFAVSAPLSNSDFIQSSSLTSFLMAMSTVSIAKLASSFPSPASAQANRVASAEKRSHASPRVMKLPSDLLIFLPSTSTCPLVNIERGHSSGLSGHTAAWLYSDMVRWLLIRSFPETRRSIGYQYANSRFIAASGSADRPAGAGLSRNTKSKSSSVHCAALSPEGPTVCPVMSPPCSRCAMV
mmetsp:Transcript_19068/g.48562  ORF Transcript_19068/g.48562 Transcript_19068/m.48562 type:complete len:275 (-) Transcript_19068:2131-2955(-)